MRIPALAALFLSLSTLAAAQATANWNYFGKTGPLGWESWTEPTRPAPRATSNRPSTFAARTSTSRSNPSSSTTSVAPSRLRTPATP